jgi:hypothetical protein
VRKFIKAIFCPPVLRAGHYGEHIGFVLLAGAETFGLHPLLWYISAGLFVTGLLAIGYDRINA